MLRPLTGREGDALAQLADVVDRVVRRGVHLDHVQRARLRDRAARLAVPARLDRRPALAVEARREDLRHRGLARPARADEQVGVVHAPPLDGVAQRAHHGRPGRRRPRTSAGGGGGRATRCCWYRSRPGRVYPATAALAARHTVRHRSSPSPQRPRAADFATRGDSVRARDAGRRQAPRRPRAIVARRDRCCGSRRASGSPTTTRSTRSSGASSSRAAQTPQYGIPIAPTPHPLIEALGFVLSPLAPRTAEDVTVALAFLALSACGWAVYRLGRALVRPSPPARSPRCCCSRASRSSPTACAPTSTSPTCCWCSAP